MDYQPVEIHDKKLFDARFSECGYSISEFTFTNMYLWRHAFSLEWREIGKALAIRGAWAGQRFHFFPAGVPEQAITALDSIVSCSGSVQLRSVAAAAIPWLKNRYTGIVISDATDDYDYVYSVSELCMLTGRKYEKKRHHINKLMRLYPNAEYRAVEAGMLGRIRECAERWYENVSSNDMLLDYERQAIHDVLDNWQILQVKGAALQVGSKVIAFTAGEKLSGESVVIHIEKADTAYDGAYQMINREFLRNEWHDCNLVNREEDMGIPQLRVAKKSYHPVQMLEKYIVDIKGSEVL